MTREDLSRYRYRDINDRLFRSVRQGLYRLRDAAGTSAPEIGEEGLRVHPDGIG